MNLHYNTVDAGLSNQPLYSGNISAMEWQTVQTTGYTTPVTTGRKAYVYRYDELSRLALGEFHEDNSGSWQQTDRFNEWISGYDLNGNIKGLKRSGSLSNWSTATIDQLSYHYQGNQLVAVDDRVGMDNGYDFFDNGHYFYHTGIIEYEYDANGNVTRDVNKGIIDISYDHNNLPVEIDLLRDNKLVYLYDANGNKLRQEVIRSRTLQKRTDFIGNFVMRSNAPAWLNFDEGRILLNGTSVTFTETHLKDHLGNTRVALGLDEGEVEVKQVNSYYPFGMNIKGLTTFNGVPTTKAYQPNEYLYNGKMFQDELGLDWLDYGARMYDAVLGRWHAVDLIAEEYRRWSPYNYCVDNPMRFIDPDGMQIWPAVAKQAMGADNYARIHSTENIANSYNSLPNDTKRIIGGTWNMVSGATQFLGGAAVGVGSYAMAAPLGAAISLHGGYKAAEGLHQVINVISGTNESEDPEFATPEGSATNSKIVDNAVDLGLGSIPSDVGSIVNTINMISNFFSASGLVIDSFESQNKNEVKAINRVEPMIETIDTPTSSYYMPFKQ